MATTETAPDFASRGLISLEAEIPGEMVDVLGHFAMALLWALPAWFVWDGRVSLAFVALTLATAMLPDVDLALLGVLPIHHHGVTHTIVFVLGVSVIAGFIVEYAIGPWLERAWLRDEGEALSSGALFLFVTGAFLLGGLSHLLGDVLSAPDISTPIEPFWPFMTEPVSVDVLWYTSPWWNEGLLLVAVVAHVILAYADIRIDHPYRIRRDV